jgi:hypothetical protein
VFGNQWVKEKFLAHQTLNQCGVVLSFSKEELVSKGWVISTLDWQLSQNQRTTFDFETFILEKSKNPSNNQPPQAFHLCQFFQQTHLFLEKTFKIPELVVILP